MTTNGKKTSDDYRKKNDRLHYWNNNYYHYWKERVDEANSSQGGHSKLVENDKPTTSDRQYFETIELLNIVPDSSVLELGCGFGRSLPYLYQKTHSIAAFDISMAMVLAAKKNCSSMECLRLLVSEIENSPFKSGSFDYVICYAVFDALYQNEALLEINRLLRQEGKALVTGKNDNYYEDDQEALIAEINARKKGHPNYFTNVTLLLEKLPTFGFELEYSRFFLRRSDMADDHYRRSQPEKFYSYTLVLKKIKNPRQVRGLQISHAFSQTFNTIEEQKRGFGRRA